MAEEENARLRGLVDLQKRDVRNIKRMMRRRNDAELMDEMHHAKRPKLSNNQEICDKLLEGIDQLYADLDKLYKVKNMAGVPCPGRKHQIYPDAADGTPFVEYMDKNQVPFDYQHAQDAVWKFLQGPRLREGHHACSKEFEQSSCTCKSAIGYTNSEQGMTSYVLEQRVARKYVEVKRTVFISRTLAEPTTSKAWPAGLRFSETMSAVVTPGNTLASGQETAVIEILLSVSRYVDGDKATVLKEWPAYVDVAAKGWSRKVSFNSQEIENLLIDESVGRGTG
ncbi:uncharacterized protein IUM83_19112 [Phytophthora cinnamomi]|uniref:uncharacterized protein n=1 Tax=Phytophthora cinnamomi TaxID=4785 RepID=UPI00355A153E|nr:hypothetical protein IUM83_19112 [Phytophthora cinnamomi]